MMKQLTDATFDKAAAAANALLSTMRFDTVGPGSVDIPSREGIALAAQLLIACSLNEIATTLHGIDVNLETIAATVDDRMPPLI
jgi:hypothetical protein